MNTLLSPAATVPVATAAPTSTELALMLLGPSTAMAQLWSQMRRLAAHFRTLLLTGAPGCGQEAVARLLLDLSAQPRRPFLQIEAVAAEDKLTRALQSGTLPAEAFLYFPDVDQLSPVAQSYLLQLLRTRRPQSLSVVAAVTENLRTLVSLGRFSAELAEMLSPVRIAVPALSERVEDLPMLLHQMLAMRFQARQCSAPQLAEGLLRAAMQHSWTGNLDELAEVAEELARKAGNAQVLDFPDWQRAVQAQRVPKPACAQVRLARLDTIVQEHIYGVLRACSGNKQRAAEILGISRSTLYRMLEAAANETPLPLAGKVA